jgi:short subunit dehydrogenase-like uncharacterized protein
MAAINRPVVNRSNALQGWRYGMNFLYSEHLRVPNALVAVLVSVSMAVAGILLLLPPVRALLKLALYKPGMSSQLCCEEMGLEPISLFCI